jgi:hypothetical protein
MTNRQMGIVILALLAGISSVILVMGISGCGQEDVVPDVPAEVPLSFKDTSDTSLAELLTKSRDELAEMAEDLATRIRVQEKAHRDSTLLYTLLPELHLPLVVPVFRQARFSTRSGFSLPPYLVEGTKDSDVALHLARYGDVEAARKLVDLTDTATRRQLDQYAGPRNYPVEWARVVGLLLHFAQVRLATGDLEGGSDLAVWHRQLKEVLDTKAAKGPLGASLLPRGRKALALAEKAWREQKHPVLAEQARDILQGWDDPPASTATIPLGSSQDEVARLLRSPAEGRLVVSQFGSARALDLLNLPLPDDTLETVVSFFDRDKRLTEVLLVYRSKTTEYYPDPTDLALLLQEQVQSNPAPTRAQGLLQCAYPLGDLACDVSIVSRNDAAGGLVSFHAAKPTDEAAPKLSRDFGAVNLDRSFEQNRIRLAPEQRGPTLETERADALKAVINPLRLPLTQVVLQRETDHDLVARLVLRYLEHSVPLHKLVLPLWSVWGPGRFEGVDDEHGGHLAIVWEDNRTRYILRLAHTTTEAVELEVTDRQPPEQLAQRATAAVALDRSERQTRFANGKLLTRLPRFLETEPIQLGMSRDAVQQVLPGGKTVLNRSTPDGLLLTFLGDPARGATFMARNLVLRFGADKRLVEIRARYQDTSAPGNGPHGMQALMTNLRKRGGAPAESPSPWAQLWPDLTTQKPTPVRYRWQDDATVMTCQIDSGGAEVTIRDRPLDQDNGVTLAPLEHLSHGPEGCVLGAAREDVMRRWATSQPTTTKEGALVLTPEKGGPYDALLVWFDNDKVSRIVARHTPPAEPPTQPGALAAALNEAWGREIRNLGWPRRQDLTSNDVLQGLGWHDEQTRVRLFWQEPDQGAPRLYTEWKSVR